MEKEIWKDIVGYEGLYQVSNLGNVKSLARGNRAEKNIKQNTNYGYKCVYLYKDHKLKDKRVHRIVAEVFLDKNDFKSMPDEDRNLIDLNDLQINHKDENKKNNRVNNLEWCTAKYNSNYGSRNKKVSNLKRKKINQYDLEGNFIREWDSISKIEKELGLHHSNIIKVCSNLRNKTGGYKWKYSLESEVN